MDGLSICCCGEGRFRFPVPAPDTEAVAEAVGLPSPFFVFASEASDFRTSGDF